MLVEMWPRWTADLLISKNYSIIIGWSIWNQFKLLFLFLSIKYKVFKKVSKKAMIDDILYSFEFVQWIVHQQFSIINYGFIANIK